MSLQSPDESLPQLGQNFFIVLGCGGKDNAELLREQILAQHGMGAHIIACVGGEFGIAEDEGGSTYLACPIEYIDGQPGELDPAVMELMPPKGEFMFVGFFIPAQPSGYS